MLNYLIRQFLTKIVYILLLNSTELFLNVILDRSSFVQLRYYLNLRFNLKVFFFAIWKYAAKLFILKYVTFF